MLPRRPDGPKAAADYGTLVHHWKETGDAFPVWADERDCEYLLRKLELSVTQRDDWWTGGEHEVSFAISIYTREWLVFRGARVDAERWKHSHDPRRWLTGTIDYRRHGWIDDLKTGKWWVSPETKQLLSYGLLDYAMSDYDTDWTCERSITWWPIYPLGKQPVRTYGPTMTAMDAECHFQDLVYSAEHPTEANPTPLYIGPWDPDEPLSPCAFCRCRVSFPVAAWMTNYRYNATEHCLPGMLRRLATASSETNE